MQSCTMNGTTIVKKGNKIFVDGVDVSTGKRPWIDQVAIYICITIIAFGIGYICGGVQ